MSLYFAESTEQIQLIFYTIQGMVNECSPRRFFFEHVKPEKEMLSF